jgi:hypothetical protein
MVDNLSRSLQSKTISACEGQRLVSITLTTLEKIRSDDCFDLFWDYIEVKRSSVTVAPPALPRRRKAPRRFEIGEATPDYPTTAEDHYRRIYFEAIDLVVGCIKDRFNQKGYVMLQKLETLLIVKNCQDTMKEVTDFYSTDIISSRLEAQLQLFHSTVSPNSLQSVISYLKSLSTAEKDFYSEIIKIAKLILVMPATNATCERSFSALRRLKTWLRSTTSQARLNWCMLLHIHKQRTDNICLCDILFLEMTAEYAFLDELDDFHVNLCPVTFHLKSCR